MYRGKKFNARKEDMYGPDSDYLGIRKYRFYIRCVACCAEVCIRTDPQNSDYVVEKGASRNFEPWKQESELNQKIQELRTQETEADTMANLENRTKESKREMEVLDALQEIQDLNNRAAKVDTGDILEARAKLVAEAEKKAIEDEVKKVNFKSKGGYVKTIESGSSDSEARRIKRAKNSVFAVKNDEEDAGEGADDEAAGSSTKREKNKSGTDASSSMAAPAAVAVVVKPKKKKKKKNKNKKRKREEVDSEKNDEEAATSGLGLVGAYGSSDSGH